MASTKIVYEIDIESGNSVKTLNSLENELSQINDELKDLEIGSDQFNKLASESRRLEGELEKVNNTVKGLTLEDKLTGADGAIKLATGTLQSFIGSVVLFGEESEALAEFEKKAIAAISVSQGLKDLSEGFSQLSGVISKLPGPTQAAAAAQRAFNLVLNANPIGLIITGITVVAGLFITFNKRIRESILQFEPLNKIIGFVGDALRKLGVALGFVASEEERLATQTRELASANTEFLEQQLELAKIRGEDTIELERKVLKERIKATIMYSDERKKAEFELQKFEEQVRADRRKEQEASQQKEIEDAKKQSEELKRIAEQRASDIAEIQKASVISASDRLALDISAVNNQYDRLVKLARKYGLDTEKLEKARLAKLEELNKEYNDKILEIEEQRYTDIELLNQNLEDLAIKYINDEEQLRKESRQKELEDTQSQFDALILEAQRLSLDTQNIELERLIAIENLKDRYKAEDEARQAELDARQAELDAERIAKATEVQNTLDNLRVGEIQNQFERERVVLERQLQNEEERLRAAGATEAQIAELKQFYSNKKLDIAKKEAEFEENLEKQKLQTNIGIAEQIVGVAGQLLGENAKKNKGIAIAESIINTLLGATKALSSSPPPFNFISAASVVAAGFKSVKQIKNTPVEGGGEPSTTTPTISAPRGLDPRQFATAQTPSITDTQNNLQQQLQQQQEEDRNRTPIKTYVLAGDVSSAQEINQKIRQRRQVGRIKPE